MINEQRREIQQEAYKALEKNNFDGVFLLPTGTGKSWVLIECLKYLCKKYKYKKIWYLCNSTNLRDEDFPNELVKWKAKSLVSKVQRMCYQTAYKLENEEVDIVIADEFDYSLTPEYVKVFTNNKIKHKICTTAFIDKDKMQYLSDIGLSVVYSKTLQQVEEQKVLNKSQYYFVNYLMSDSETSRYLEFNKRIDALRVQMAGADDKILKYLSFKESLVIRARRMFLSCLESSAFYTRKLMQDIYKSDRDCKILTFCEFTSQADGVSKYTYHNKSDQTNLQKFRDDEIQCLAVCGKVNRGVNIKGVRYVIFESCNSSRTQLVQRLGRGKRLDVDEILNVYFLIPCYMEAGTLKFTKVRDWILKASVGLNLSNAKVYNFKG